MDCPYTFFANIADYAYNAIVSQEGDHRELASDGGSRLEIVNVGPKGYPCCRRLHAPVEAALAWLGSTMLKLRI